MENATHRGRWLGALLTAGVIAVCVGVVRADTPASPAQAVEAAKRAPEPPPDPMTQAGQRALQAARAGRQHVPSPAIIPEPQIPLRFSHRLHTAELGCVECHTTVPKSLRSSDVNLPVEATCFDCHDVDAAAAEPPGDPPSTCATCHPGYQASFPEGVEPSQTHKARVHPPQVELPPPNLKFNHKVHLDRGTQCATCHAGLDRVDLATPDNALPTMGTCLGCHDGKTAPKECRTCHVMLPNGRIDTMAGVTPLAPAGWYFGDAHDDRWLHDHRAVAVTNGELCASCHDPKECIDCHNGVTKPLKIHPNNWILTHPISARKNEPDCSSCHRAQTFCVSCHQLTKFAWEPGGKGKSDLAERGLRFHPEGWVQADWPSGDGRLPPRGPNHHSFQAQRNIRACTSCHTEETCLTCHNPKTFGALAVNPHPPHFGGSARCKAMLKRNHRPCLKCHELGGAEIDACR
ncbi:MAG: cytochrome c3 family protein [Deltaproteobacteria bacterium]|nr:cytochrome c3 family protein [Deltaproteobacteria bacterium]